MINPKPKLFKATEEELDESQRAMLKIIGESFTPLQKSLRPDNSTPALAGDDDSRSLSERIESALKSEKQATEVDESAERLVGKWLLAMLSKRKLDNDDPISKCLRTAARAEVMTRALEHKKQFSI